MGDELDSARFEWDKEQARHARVIDEERLVLERRRSWWDTHPVLRAGLPVLGLVIAASQGFMAWSENQRRVAQEDRDLLARTAQLQVQFIDVVFRNLDRFTSEDPGVKCRSMKIAQLSPAYQQMIGALGEDAALCDSPAELKMAIQSHLLKNYREGASDGFVRRDPVSGQLFRESCSVTTENRHSRSDAIVSQQCAISAPQARIYRVEYSCTEPRCGWSYNPDPAQGYAMDARIEPDGRKITWRRRWDGDPVTERYTMYYEIPDAAVSIPAGEGQK